MRNSILILLIVFISSCCQQKTKDSNIATKKGTTETEFVLPDDAIRITYDGHIYLPLQLDSLKGNFLFDTGADKLYFDSIYYSQNNFTHSKKVKGNLPGAGNSTQTVNVILDTVKAKIKTYEIASNITPIIQLKKILGDFADGIIGGELLNKHIVKISYDKEYMQLYSSLENVDTLAYKKIKLRINKNRYYLPLYVKINDTLSIKGDFLLDLGSGGTITLTSQTATQFKLDENIKFKKAYYTRYGGIGGNSESFDFMANSLSIADFSFSNVVMSYSTDNSGALSDRKYLGILGNEILEKFDIIIDNTNEYLYLKPNTLYNQPFIFSEIGFSYINRYETMNAWIVTGLYKNSNAEKAGLKIDDKIIKINGKNIKNISKENNPLKTSDSVKLLINRNNNINKEIKFDLDK